MSENNRKNLLSQLKRNLQNSQNGYQSEYDRLGMDPKPVPKRERGYFTSDSGNSHKALGRRQISEAGTKKTKTMVGIPSVGTHQEFTWSTKNPTDKMDVPIEGLDLQGSEGYVPGPETYRKRDVFSEPEDGFISAGRPVSHADRVRLEDVKASIPRPSPPKETAPMCSLDESEEWEYCLMFKGNVIALNSDVSKIEAFIESLFRSFENITEDDIMIFQRVPFRVGAQIGR